MQDNYLKKIQDLYKNYIDGISIMCLGEDRFVFDGDVDNYSDSDSYSDSYSDNW